MMGFPLRWAPTSMASSAPEDVFHWMNPPSWGSTAPEDMFHWMNPPSWGSTPEHVWLPPPTYCDIRGIKHVEGSCWVNGDAGIMNESPNDGDGGLNEPPGDGGMNEPTDYLYGTTVPDGWGDPNGKSAIYDQLGIDAGADKWGSKEISSGSKASWNTSGEKETGVGGGSGGCNRGAFVSSRNACLMCGEGEHFSGNCGLCILVNTYDGLC